MECPRCAARLSTTTHEGAELQRCVECDGSFLTYDALRTALTSEARPRSEAERSAAIAASATAATAAPDEREPLRCPACQAPMRRYVHQYASGVWVDTCEEHGLWLDPGELQGLEAYAEAAQRGQMPDGTAPVRSDTPARRPRREVDGTDPGVDPGTTFSDAGMVADVLAPIPVLGTLGAFLDHGRHLLDWRRHDRQIDTRAQHVVDEARRDHS